MFRLPEVLDIAGAVTLYEHEQCIGRKQVRLKIHLALLRMRTNVLFLS